MGVTYQIPTGLTQKWVMVTPNMAQMWLAKSRDNVTNRRTSQGTVETYASDMKNARWIMTGEPLLFDEDGNCIDGWHRMEAVILSGCTVPFLTVKNIPTVQNGYKSIEAIDSGKSRTAPEILTISGKMSGEVNHKCAILRMLVYLCTRSFPRKLSPLLLHNLYSLYKIEIDAVMENCQGKVLLRIAPVTAAFVFAARNHKEDVLTAERIYFEPDVVSKNHPMVILREYVINPRNKVSTNAQRMDMGSITLLAMMHTVNKQEIKMLRPSKAGHEFFLAHQSKTINDVRDFMRF